MDIIDSIADLETHYGTPAEATLRKETSHLTRTYQAWIASSPFFALASVGPEGLDCSPRGDAAPAAFVIDEKTIHIPDRRGNNRLDTLRNIVRDGRVALLWLIPGTAECMRVNGTAVLCAEDDLRARYEFNGKLPASVIVVTVESAYFQCARAIKRSRLWNSVEDAPTPPTAGTMITDAMPDFDGESYDEALADRQRDTMY